MNDQFQAILNQYKLKTNRKFLNAIQKYCHCLYEANKKLNLVSNSEINNVLVDHIGDSLSFSMINLRRYKLKDTFSLVDIGSGGGFPGIPIALLYPEASITLLESVKKKAKFLNEITLQLQVDNIKVIAARAEAIGLQQKHRQQYDIATTRAVGNLGLILEYAIPLIKLGGIFVAYKTEKSNAEVIELKNVLSALKTDLSQTIYYDIPTKDLKRTLLIFEKYGTTDTKFPRKVGIPAKKPLK